MSACVPAGNAPTSKVPLPLLSVPPTAEPARGEIGSGGVSTQDRTVGPGNGHTGQGGSCAGVGAAQVGAVLEVARRGNDGRTRAGQRSPVAPGAVGSRSIAESHAERQG